MTTVDRANNFVIVVERRMTQVYKTLSLIGNLSNKRYYEYSDEEVNELFLKLLDKGNEIKKFFLEYSNSRTEFYEKKRNLSSSFHFLSPKLENEKNDNFREIAESRVSKVFGTMNSIANTAYKPNYDYTNQQVEEIFEGYKNKIVEIKGIYSPLEKFSFSTQSKIIIEKWDKMEFWNDTIQTVKEWRPVNYQVSDGEDFETVKRRAIADFENYLKLLNDGTEESRKKVIHSFTFSKFIGEELCNDEDLKKLSKRIRHQLRNGNS